VAKSIAKRFELIQAAKSSETSRILVSHQSRGLEQQSRQLRYSLVIIGRFVNAKEVKSLPSNKARRSPRNPA
jgi:hypothetical protein